MKGDEAHNLPWTQDNVKEWLYRPVAITDRPKYSQTMLAPRKVDGKYRLLFLQALNPLFLCSMLFPFIITK